MLKDDYFRENFKYDPATGVVTRLNARNRRGVINRFGCETSRGYIMFDTPERAHAAYCAAAKTHFGEFARAA